MDAVIRFLDVTLDPLKNYLTDFPVGEREEVTSFLDELTRIRCLFSSLESRWDEHKEAKDVLTEIRDGIFGAVLEAGSLLANALKQLRSGTVVCKLSPPLADVVKELKSVKEGMMDLFDGLCDIESAEIKASLDDSSSSKVNSSEAESVVGFEDDAMTLIERLTGFPMKLQIVSIVGMAGLRKTTLARKLYHDPYIAYHFYIRAWTSVSQVYHERDVLLAILSSITELTNDIYARSDEKLGEELYRRLKGKRYLIVMDDVWNIHAWNDLKRFFPNDNVGSRIIFISRLRDVNLQAQPDSQPHCLRFLTEDESWDLLQKKVFPRNHCPYMLIEIGKRISQKCHGLPLAIVVVAGLLENKTARTWWNEVAESVSSYIVNDPKKYMDVLEMSYSHLPHHLKACFLYFGAFPEDFEIPVQKLIWLWVAEGFIRKSGNQSLEEVAEDYLTDLLKRSLVIVGKRGCTGRIKSCRIHDMLRDLCLRKAEEENFAPQIYRYGRITSSSSFPRPPPPDPYSSGTSQGKYILPHAFFRSSSEPYAPPAYSLLCFGIELCKSIQEDPSIIYESFKLVRVLDLLSVCFLVFPSEIVQLRYLRYLAVQAKDGSPPALISNLLNLEILIISSRKNIIVPQSVWKMTSLRHIYF